MTVQEFAMEVSESSDFPGVGDKWMAAHTPS